jgi:hypothetical protein
MAAAVAATGSATVGEGALVDLRMEIDRAEEDAICDVPVSHVEEMRYG